MSVEVQRQIRDILDRLERLEKTDAPLSAIRVRVYNGGNQSIPNNTATALTFDNERYDTDGMHSTSVNTSRITFTKAGLYRITLQVQWANNTAGMREISIRLNGGTYLAIVDDVPNTSFGHAMIVSTDWECDAGDYAEGIVFQNSGGSLNAVVAANYSNEFMATRIP